MTRLDEGVNPLKPPNVKYTAKQDSRLVHVVVNEVAFSKK